MRPLLYDENLAEVLSPIAQLILKLKKVAYVFGSQVIEIIMNRKIEYVED